MPVQIPAEPLKGSNEYLSVLVLAFKPGCPELRWCLLRLQYQRRLPC